MIDEEALDKAAREGYAVRCKTFGPRTLAKYASDDIMQRQIDDARVIVTAYLAALAQPASNAGLQRYDVTVISQPGMYAICDMRPTPAGQWVKFSDVSAIEPAPLWRDIESAPKDGTKVLVIDEYGNQTVASYREGQACWWGGGFFQYPHRWQPLPLPPAPSEVTR